MISARKSDGEVIGLPCDECREQDSRLILFSVGNGIRKKTIYLCIPCIILLEAKIHEARL
jgi:hypothetical protein